MQLRVPLLLAFLAMSTQPGCLEAGRDDAPSETAPVAGTLDFQPRTFVVGQAADVNGTLAFTDSDGDVNGMGLRLRFPDGSVSDDALLQVDTGGLTSGILSFTLNDLQFDEAGDYLLEAWVTDGAGQRSAEVTGAIEVQDAGPVAGTLNFQPRTFVAGQTKDVEGTLAFTDVDGNVTGMGWRLRSPDGSASDEGTVAVDVDGLTTGTLPFVLEDVRFDAPGDYALEAWVTDAAGLRSAPVSGAIDVQGLSDGMDACQILDVSCEGEGWCYNVRPSTCEYFEEHGLELDACADIDAVRVVPRCVSSVLDLENSLVTDETACTFVQYWSNPTHLPMDCRCPEARMDERCRRPYDLGGSVSFGTGPRPRELAGTVQSWRGTIVGREWYLPVAWSTSSRKHQTMIFAVDLDTGARRFVSGAYEDPRSGYTTVGTGDAFVQIMDLKLHSDGFLYGVGATSDIAAPKLWKIDPKTGARTKIFDAETAADAELCPNFSTLPGTKVVQMTPEGWAMDDAGNHYFSMVNMPGPSVVKLRIGGDGKASCSYLTSVNDCPTCSFKDDIGTGYSDVQFDIRAFSIHDGKLFAVSDTKLLEIDLTTGNRRLMSAAKDPGGLGKGPINAEGLGDRWTTWDPHRNVLWTVGSTASNLAVAVDLDTGDRTSWPCWHPGQGIRATCNSTGTALPPGPLNYGGMVIDPEGDHDLFFAHDLFSVARYDTTTGNSYTFSL